MSPEPTSLSNPKPAVATTAVSECDGDALALTESSGAVLTAEVPSDDVVQPESISGRVIYRAADDEVARSVRAQVRKAALEPGSDNARSLPSGGPATLAAALDRLPIHRNGLRASIPAVASLQTPESSTGGETDGRSNTGPFAEAARLLALSESGLDSTFTDDWRASATPRELELDRLLQAEQAINAKPKAILLQAQALLERIHVDLGQWLPSNRYEPAVVRARVLKHILNDSRYETPVQSVKALESAWPLVCGYNTLSELARASYPALLRAAAQSNVATPDMADTVIAYFDKLCMPHLIVKPLSRGAQRWR